ncbi:alpha/beta fold hydrolase [Micromonospora sp. HK10]|uniref:alpha/beta fold hydrolase n=1 Tax=Micromonospora sp. HK10 TaxID=1538294 RepID=UPI000A65E3FA|nr:alpha/beta fold hydrolase [Micromonospora sp. HK10]
MSGTRRALARAAVTILAVTAITAATSTAAVGRVSLTAACDTVPTGVRASDHWLPFTVPAGLMPDAQFDGLRAHLQVHRVRPVYAHGRCRSVPSRAAVLIHGRTVYGPPVFDLRQRAPEGGDLSVQRALARAGVDTFAPNLLGYGRSTRFAHGLDDPGNASLPGYEPDGTCGYPAGCDRTHVAAFPLDQQGSPELLFTHPLDGQRRSHSSHLRFARVDTFVRDIRQVIDDAIARARPSDGRVTLVGYSAGGQHVARTLYAANPNPLLPQSDRYIAKVNRVVFLSSLFLNNSTEEPTPPTGWATFPLRVYDAADVASTWQMPAERETACTGHVVPGSPGRLWRQVLAEESTGLRWGGDVPGHPTGLARSPVFSSYGWNTAVAGQLTPPTLVLHGVEDTTSAVGNADTIYGALPPSMTNKILVKVACASHALLLEGCAGPRCTPSSGIPYGGRPHVPWAGPHATLRAALVEWIRNGTVNGASTGRFLVNESGVLSPLP